LKISEEENSVTAEFTQSYSSSISKYSGKKKLSLRKINDQWKIYREVINETRILKYIAPVSSQQNEPKDLDEVAVQNLVNNWLDSWKSGNMGAYRSCYASDFKSGGMNLDEWVSHRADAFKKSKNINISINNLKILEEENSATAEFTQSYSSSISKYSGKKKLSLRKINDQWKIYREVLNETRILK
jgi:ketosteroid isomerase-like protein